MATLTLEHRGTTLWTHELVGPRHRIGRDPALEVVLSDPGVSRLHAVLTMGLDGARLIDNSTNGTLVNGVPRRVATIRDGDVVSIGAFELIYHETQAAGDLPTTVSATAPLVIGYNATECRLISEQPLLLVYSSSREPRCFSLGEKARVGSREGCEVKVPDLGDTFCFLERQSGGYRLTSQGSPIQYDGTIASDVVLPYGSRCRVGSVDLELHTEDVDEVLTPSGATRFEGLVGSTPAMRTLFSCIERVAPLDAPVVLLGETGTGKELVAQALHKRSRRAQRPFIAINCGAISRELAESELFGHEKGAFTGAVSVRDGAFQQAHTGTLFLDEIGELPLDLQVKLLRVLETGQCARVGTTNARPVDVRIIAATHRDLAGEVKRGRFRADLFFRLLVIPIQLPPLRDRREDIPLLAEHFLAQHGTSAPKLTSPARLLLQSYTWPGNVRELKHLITRTVAGVTGHLIRPEDIQFMPAAREEAPATNIIALEAMEKEMIERALRTCGSRVEAALALGVARSTLFVKIKKYGLDSISPG